MGMYCAEQCMLVVNAFHSANENSRVKLDGLEHSVAHGKQALGAIIVDRLNVRHISEMLVLFGEVFLRNEPCLE